MGDDDVTVSIKVSKSLARRWRRDWRELLSGVWEGVSRARRCGVPEGHVATAGTRAAVDALRAENPDPERSRYRSRGKGIPHVSGYTVLYHTRRGVVSLFDATAAPRPVDTLPDRLASLWADTRDAREGMPPRARVWLYLMLVEGWGQAEVAAAFGVTQSAVSLYVKYHTTRGAA